MITFSRSVARQIAKVFRVALDLTPAQAARQPVSIQSDEQGVVVCSQTARFGISYRLPVAGVGQRYAIPLALFTSVGGKQPEPVTIERTVEQSICARWQDGAIPQQSQWPELEVDSLGETWSEPTQWVEQDGQLWQALADASATTDGESSRYALGCLQLRGPRGEIAATDGRQVLLQGGFSFGWEEDILVPGSKLFGYGELPRHPQVRVGRTPSHVVFEFGPWRFWLAIETESRFPRVDDIIPSPDFATTRVALERGDVRFLADNLKRLPVPAGAPATITMDLNGSVAVRARSEDLLRTTELVLSNSHRAGDEVRIVSDRRYLQRAATLGFPNLCVYSPRSPVLCHDERRKYVWALWSPDDAVTSGADVVRVASPQATCRRSPRLRPASAA